jgi:transcriptional regulator with XRE-family HTH domain
MNNKATQTSEKEVDELLIEAEENLVIDAQFMLQGLINESGISRAELARKVGISKARLSQLMSSEANPTLRTLAGLFYALGVNVTLSQKSTVALDKTRAWSEIQSTEYAPLLDRLGFAEILLADNRDRKAMPLIVACNDDRLSDAFGDCELAVA